MDNGLVPGEIRLRVPDLGRSLAFYADFLGFRAKRTAPRLAELSADGVTPLVVLEERPGATVLPPQSHTGLYHVAFLLPERRFLGAFLARLLESRMPFGHADHFVSEAIYISDPDGNGIEIYRDRPREEWPMAGPEVRMANAPLDFDGIVAAAGDRPWDGIAPEARIGHVHLQVSDLAEAERFYCRILGFNVMQRWRGALFVSAGGYHHHIGLNVWSSLGGPPPPEDSAGLEYFEIRLPSAEDLARLKAVLSREGIEFAETTTDAGRPAIRLRDFDRIGILISA